MELTFENIKEYVLRDSGVPEGSALLTATHLNNVVNAAYRDFMTETCAQWRRSDSGEVTIGAGYPRTYGWPDDFVGIIQVELAGNAPLQPLTLLANTRLHQDWNTVGVEVAASVTHVYISGQRELAFYPRPGGAAAATDIFITGWIAPVPQSGAPSVNCIYTLSANGDIPALDTAYHEALVFGAIWRACTFILRGQDDAAERAVAARTEYERMVNDARTYYSRMLGLSPGQALYQPPVVKPNPGAR